MDRDQTRQHTRASDEASDETVVLEDAVTTKRRGEKLIEETRTLTSSSKALLERLEPQTR